MNLEIERRFLVKLPLSDEAKEKIGLPNTILQIYLLNSEGLCERVRRKTVNSTFFNSAKNFFYHTTKKNVSPGISIEDESRISEEKYIELLKNKDERRHPIQKDRYDFDFQYQSFELDLFRGGLEGLSILEIELKDLKDEVALPPFLEIIKEITGQKEYSNYQLAKDTSWTI